MHLRQATKLARRRKAMILLLVLITVVLLSLGAYSFTDLMLAHHEAALLTGRQVQARALVDSGVEVVRLALAQTEEQRLEAGGVFDNVETFRGVTLIPDDNPNDRGSFSIISPMLDADGNLNGTRYGVEDESTRLNLNTLLHAESLMQGAGRQLLMALPGMTEDIADAILDWIDEDDTERELGAEVGYYSGLSPGYAPKNGPLATVEELLLVRGVTPDLLFGADVNRNGQLDSHESFDPASPLASSDDPAAFRGWAAYLTLHSLEWNTNPDGNPRIYLNEPDLNKLKEQLEAVFPAEWVTFIIAYRQAGPLSGAGNTRGEPADGPLNMNFKSKTAIGQVLDLVGAQVRYTYSGDTQSTLIDSPFDDAIGAMNVYMPLLMDHVTVNPAGTIPGRININQAPRTVLLGIPGMQPEIVDQIITRRDVIPSSDKPNRRHETWLLQEGVVTMEEMKTMMPFITAGGDVYRAQVVGYFQGGQASSRAEVIFDATYTLPRLVFWRDISHLGRGYALETLGVDYTEQATQ